MKRQNIVDLSDRPLKKQKLLENSTEELNDTANYNNDTMELPKIPNEVICNHIVPHFSRSWLFVSKKCHRIAFNHLVYDARLQEMFSNAKDGLIRACKNGNVRAVQMLLDHGHVTMEDDYNWKTEDKFGQPIFLRQPLEWLAKVIINSNNYAIIQRFVNDQRTPTPMLEDCLNWTIRQGHYEMTVHLLRDQRLSATTNKESNALSSAIDKCQVHIVQYLLRECRDTLDVNTDQFSVPYAANLGNYAIVDELIRHGFDPTANYNNAIRVAASRGHYEIVKRLLMCPQVDPMDKRHYEQGDNIYYMSNALEEALYRGDMGIVQLLLSDARVSLTDEVQRRFEHLLPGTRPARN